MAFLRGHPIADDALSAYIDGELSERERSRVEAHVEGCARCQAAVAELRAVRATLQGLPQARAPRSFALREADVRAPSPPLSSGLFRAAPMLGAVAAVALLAFFSLVGVDLAGGAGGGGGTTGASRVAQPAADAASEGGAPEYRFESPAIQGDGRYGDALGPEEATAPAPALPATGEEAATPEAPLAAPRRQVEAEEDDRTGLRAAEAATAALALVAGGTFVFARRRRKA